MVAASYAIVAGFLFACGQYAEIEASEPDTDAAESGAATVPAE
jgi:hypothetical protein